MKKLKLPVLKLSAFADFSTAIYSHARNAKKEADFDALRELVDELESRVKRHCKNNQINLNNAYMTRIGSMRLNIEHLHGFFIDNKRKTLGLTASEEELRKP